MRTLVLILVCVSAAIPAFGYLNEEEKEIRRMLPLITYREDVIDEEGRLQNTKLVEVASSDKQWTGIAVAKDKRIFVCFPRWSDDVKMSVGVIQEEGYVKTYPNAAINTYRQSKNPAENFICVQSLYADEQNNLWVLDAANPKFEGVVKGGPKLVKIDLKRDTLSRTYSFDESVTPQGCYLNDVRIDNSKKLAYISDSGLGAIIVLNLETGKASRILEGHYSTRSEGIDIVINGEKWRIENGSKPEVHCDGIALAPNGRDVYYQALTGRTIYRIPTMLLKEENIRPAILVSKVEVFAEPGAADGIAFDRTGNLYLTSLEENAIRRVTPKGDIQIVYQDDKIQWPDSIAIGPMGEIYFTTSLIHMGNNPEAEYKIFKIIFE